MSVHVRPAELADGMALATVHARALRARGRASEDVLTDLEAPGRDAVWRLRLGEVLVAAADDDEGRVVGFVWFGAAMDDPGFGEVYLVAVDPDRWRTGVGTALLDAVAPALAAQGFDAAIAWTADDDPAAQALCRAAGWGADGTTREATGGVDEPAHRHQRALAGG